MEDKRRKETKRRRDRYNLTLQATKLKYIKKQKNLFLNGNLVTKNIKISGYVCDKKSRWLVRNALKYECGKIVRQSGTSSLLTWWQSWTIVGGSSFAVRACFASTVRLPAKLP